MARRQHWRMLIVIARQVTARCTHPPVPHPPTHPCPHCLQFLDAMIQRDSLQKAAFLRDLPAMCAQFDSRVLRFKASRRSRLQAAGSRITTQDASNFGVQRL